MAGINGIGGVQEPSAERPVNLRDRKREDEVRGAAQQDGVAISPEAREAANVSRLMQAAQSDSDARSERVAAARQRLQEESFKLPEVVAEVARKLSKYLP